MCDFFMWNCQYFEAPHNSTTNKQDFPLLLLRANTHIDIFQKKKKRLENKTKITKVTAAYYIYIYVCICLIVSWAHKQHLLSLLSL